MQGEFGAQRRERGVEDDRRLEDESEGRQKRETTR